MITRCHQFFQTLASKLKLDIILALQHQSLTVSALVHELAVERTRVSHALRNLHDCGFVQQAQQGRQRIYSLNQDTMVPLLELVKTHVEKYCTVCDQSRTPQ